VGTTLAEGVLIADWIQEPKTAWRLKRFRRQFVTWHNTTGSETEIISRFLNTHDNPLLGKGIESSEVTTATDRYLNLRLMCPFNARDGSCRVYPIRPLACRVHFVTGTSEYCRWRHARKPILLKHAKLTEMTEIARSILLGASAKAGCPHRLAPPEAVDRALAKM
jgi:Fe-S-cluster containining protein